MKLAVMSHALPPSPSGQAVMLGRILRDLDPEQYCLIATGDSGSDTDLSESLPRLPARYYSVPPDWRIELPDLPVIRSLRMLVNLIAALVPRTCALGRIIRSERCTAFVACSGSVIGMPAAFLACQWTRTPFYAYIFDDFAHHFLPPEHRHFARRIAPAVFRHAAGIIVPNEFLRDEYRRRYGVEPVVIHNPIEPIKPSAALPWPADENEIKIIYTGAIYDAHYDAFYSLLAALDLLGRPGLTLHIYTAEQPSQKELAGIKGPVVFHPHVSAAEAIEIQRRADILFLPLAFNSPYPAMVRTATPGKMGEYLASGRPILAQVPADSFVSWYLKTYDAAKICDRDDPADLAQAILQMIEASDLREKWCQNALVRAETDFSLERAQRKFTELFHIGRAA